jgi:tRNA nucleotidyltransferase (CCA-adding enzyme)
MARPHRIDPAQLPERLEALPGIEVLRRIGESVPAYLVGGAVRDVLLGADRADLDVVVEADVRPLAQTLGGEVLNHDRFETATVKLDGVQVDLARARAESYPQPGALPEVRPAPIQEDLARRDFTINAMAVPLRGPPELIDPHGGLKDLGLGLLRVLHPRSFIDDPTRALRAARYAARMDLELEPNTAKLMAIVDLSSVSADRIDAELRRIAAEEEAPRALGLIREWRIADVPEPAIGLAATLRELAMEPPWSAVADPVDAIVATVEQGPGSAAIREQAEALTHATPERPSDVVRAVGATPPVAQLLGRAMGAAWLDDYETRWRDVRLEINGRDLMAAGVPEGPAVGQGLAAALYAKLDGEISGREQELSLALQAARQAGSSV